MHLLPERHDPLWTHACPKREVYVGGKKACLLVELKRFRDPIHGFISLYPIEVDIIRDSVFQRIRNIRQLSLAHYVYHGAEHTRFGHALGATHIAGRAYRALRKNGGNIEHLDDQYELTLRIAALLHDVGHPPFSHALENILGSSHEEYSQALVEYHFGDRIRKVDVDINDVNNLISGMDKKSDINNIISGQLDVDRLDYLLRDSYYSGVAYGKYDLDRIIESMAIRDERFVILQGGYEAVEQMIFARYQMYQQVYFHKTKRSFELMLLKCAEIMKKNGELEYPTVADLKNGSAINKFAELDDRWFLNMISDSRDKKVKQIAEMIKKRIPYVETYSPISYKQFANTKSSTSYDYTEGLTPIKNAFINEMDDLKIAPHEFLHDSLARAPYDLAVDPNVSGYGRSTDTSIHIHYDSSNLLEPIEMRSHLVRSLATNHPPMIRGFVHPDKYDVVRDYLKKFDYVLPERP